MELTSAHSPARVHRYKRPVSAAVVNSRKWAHGKRAGAAVESYDLLTVRFRLHEQFTFEDLKKDACAYFDIQEDMLFDMELWFAPARSPATSPTGPSPPSMRPRASLAACGPACA